MTAYVLTGSKQEIAEKVTQIQGEIREAIVFTDDPPPPFDPTEDIFAEMEPYTVRATSVDDSREAIYQRLEGE
jgi:hypothetical protein